MTTGRRARRPSLDEEAALLALVEIVARIAAVERKIEMLARERTLRRIEALPGECYCARLAPREIMKARKTA